MINKCGICCIRTGYKKLLVKVIKFGKGVHTLIHPPSQCDCRVQQDDDLDALVDDLEASLHWLMAGRLVARV